MEAAQLDCSTPESTLNSLAPILQLTPAVLRNRILEFDLNPYLDADPGIRIGDLLVEQIASAQAASVAPAIVNWFHATRVPTDTDFHEGLRPLNTILDRIWHLLGELASQWLGPEEWAGFRDEMDCSSGDDPYALKVGSSMHWGPYGFLVQEYAFNASSAVNHDYFDIPEIVEDVCQSFGPRFKKDLLGAYHNATCPCVVKFLSDEPRPDTVPSALFYLYTTHHDGGFPTEANTCFNGFGKTIPREYIVDVTFYPDANRGA